MFPPDTGLVGQSPAMQRVRAQLRRYAPLCLPVLLRGPTGTGKDLAAQALHQCGPRSPDPFVPINCATLSTDLADSALFGHVRGAFTGALRDHAGAFVRAGRGTVFLDEVGELDLVSQAKLLRVLENRRLTPVGSDREQDVQARVVAATHRNLEAMVADGGFREDLFHRLCVLTIDLPALAARPDDIEPLLQHLGRMAHAELGCPVRFTPDAIAAASQHHWPGNVRELKNAILRAAADGHGLVDADALVPLHLPGRRSLLRVGPTSATARDAEGRTTRLELLLREVERHGSINRAAAALGVPRSTLSARIRRLRQAG